MSNINKDIDSKGGKRNVSLGISLAPPDQAKSKDPLFEEKMRRFYTAFRTKSPGELAKGLAITVDAVYAAKRHQRVPKKWYYAAMQAGISADWLLSGKGPMRFGEETRGDQAGYQVHAAGFSMDDDVRFLIRLIDIVFYILTFGGQKPIKEPQQLALIAGLFYKSFFNAPNRVEILEQFREGTIEGLIKFISEP